MSDSDILESSCHVWDVDIQIPDDESIPCPIINIEIQAKLTKASYEDQDEDEDIEFSFLEPETVVIQTTEELKLELLVKDSLSAAETVSNMLVSMEYVPVRDFMVAKILDCAHRMVANRKYRNRKVLRMHVEIEAIVDQLPDDDDDDDGADEEPVSETAAIVEKLSEVVVESPNSCSICLDEFLVGREATSLPCRHFFHRHCIMSWLYNKNHCPLCRRNLSG